MERTKKTHNERNSLSWRKKKQEKTKNEKRGGGEGKKRENFFFFPGEAELVACTNNYK